MRFISRAKSPEYVLQHGKREFINTIQGTVENYIRAATVKFTPLSQPFQTSALPVRGNNDKARGILDTREAADRLRRRGHVVFDEEGKDITEKWLIQVLFDHPKYQMDFVAIDEDGTEIVETTVVPEGDGGYFCRICDKHFKDAQGASGHVANSKEHAQNLTSAGKSLVASL